MHVQGVHAARANEPEQVQRAAGLLHGAAQVGERRQPEELAGIDRVRNPHDVLRHDAPGSEIQVPDLAVPDEAFGESDGEARRGEQRAWGARPQAVPGRRLT